MKWQNLLKTPESALLYQEDLMPLSPGLGHEDASIPFVGWSFLPDKREFHRGIGLKLVKLWQRLFSKPTTINMDYFWTVPFSLEDLV